MLGVRIPPGLPQSNRFPFLEIRKLLSKTIGSPKLTDRSYIVQKVIAFFESVKLELEKVTWPTRKETIATTGVVIVIVVLISFYLGACDLVLAKLLRLILG
jgi:preprotein translocase subunit SecE